MNDFSRKFSTYALQIIFIIIFLTSANFVNQQINKPIIRISKQESAINLNATIVDLFSLGYRRLITSIFWLSTILESDHEHYKTKDTNSWMFLRFNLISTLDPNFYENYAFGGQYLSIIKDDDIGAKIILDKGLKYFPEDYQLLLITSFHYYFELHQHTEAMKIYKKLITFPQVPRHIISFYAKVISKETATEEAFEILRELYEKNKHISVFEKRYRDNLYAIRAEIDLKCLNSSSIPKQKCRTHDFNNIPYILKGKTYYAANSWKKFKVYKDLTKEKSSESK